MSVQRESSLIKLCGIVLMAVCLPVWFIASAVAEEQSAPNAKAAPCKDLKPFNNIDELLYQFWVNLDNNCLFEMPVEELEKIWDIKILCSDPTLCTESAQVASGIDFRDKPYKSEKDAFYVKIGRGNKTRNNIFYIQITKEYYEKHATLFPTGKPAFLPEPLQQMVIKLITPRNEGDKPLRPKHNGLYNMDDVNYYWLNSDKTSIINLEGLYGVTSITVMNYVHPSFIKQDVK